MWLKQQERKRKCGKRAGGKLSRFLLTTINSWAGAGVKQILLRVESIIRIWKEWNGERECPSDYKWKWKESMSLEHFE